MKFLREYDKLIRNYKESLLSDLLEQCTDGQKGIFKRMHKSIEEMKEENMRWAYGQIQRSLKLNEEKINE